MITTDSRAPTSIVHSSSLSEFPFLPILFTSSLDLFCSFHPLIRYQKKFFSLASDLTQQCGRCSNCLPDTPSSYYHLNSALKLSSAVYEVSHLLIHRPIIPSIRSREIKLMLYCWLLCGGFLAQLKTKDRILSSVVDVP